MTTRQALYRAASLIGWYQAARRGRLGARVWNVLVYRTANRAASRWRR